MSRTAQQRKADWSGAHLALKAVDGGSAHVPALAGLSVFPELDLHAFSHGMTLAGFRATPAGMQMLVWSWLQPSVVQCSSPGRSAEATSVAVVPGMRPTTAFDADGIRLLHMLLGTITSRHNLLDPPVPGSVCSCRQACMEGEAHPPTHQHMLVAGIHILADMQAPAQGGPNLSGGVLFMMSFHNKVRRQE